MHINTLTRHSAHPLCQRTATRCNTMPYLLVNMAQFRSDARDPVVSTHTHTNTHTHTHSHLHTHTHTNTHIDAYINAQVACAATHECR